VYDVVVENAIVVDGSGEPARPGAVGVADGVITAIGNVGGARRRTIDADGQVVAPGFIDIHTHYDAALTWDPAATPSSLFGVTTVVAGNCGFTLAPVELAETEYLARMLSRVEGMPLESLEASLDWSWRSFAEWLQALEGNIAVNAGFLVGHSTMRRTVMGERSRESPTEDDLAAMERLLRESLRAGGLGFSSSHGGAHNDATGAPVPSRFAGRDELVRLCRVVADFAGTSLEFALGKSAEPFSDEEIGLLTAMSAAARRAINWNLLVVSAELEETCRQKVGAADEAGRHGGRIVALTLPALNRLIYTFASGFSLENIPGWSDVFQIPIAERIAALGRPEVRAALLQGAEQAGPSHAERVAFDRYRIIDTFSPANEGLGGRVVGEVARERGLSAFDALLDIVVADELRTTLLAPARGDDDATWELRAEFWRDERVVLGGSDAGAHVDMLDSFVYPAELFANAVRDRGLLSVEEAVRLITSRPAQLYGLHERGRLAEGFRADMVIFDPDGFTSGPVQTRNDLPAGAGRLFSEPTGIDRVMVNGVDVIVANEITGARPGSVLRSGRDTIS
jgi:N-acyl-D-aspartate/D-glutamate deacylase